jgi:hypothetical protein
MSLIAITLTLSISAYTPGANRISGGSIMANGAAPHIGAFACPSHIPLGSRVTIIGEARERAHRLGLPVDGVCADRFHRRYNAGHLDICIPRGFEDMTDAQRLKRAFTWGRMRGDVVFQLLGIVAAPARQ